MRIVTAYVYPPIPIRCFDWSAIDDDSYDGADDGRSPIGRGATEGEAIAELLFLIGWGDQGLPSATLPATTPPAPLENLP